MHIAAVIAIVAIEKQAEAIVRELETTGSPKDTISAIFPDQRSGSEFIRKQRILAPPAAAPGTVSGGMVGGALGGWLLGGAIGWLVGIEALEMTGADALTTYGAIIAMLGGATVCATIGGLVAALSCIGADQAAAHRYEQRIHAGGILMLVHTEVDVEILRVRAIFERFGATAIAYTGDSYVVTG